MVFFTDLIMSSTWGSLIRSMICLPSTNTWVYPAYFLTGSVLVILLVLCGFCFVRLSSMFYGQCCLCLLICPFLSTPSVSQFYVLWSMLPVSLNCPFLSTPSVSQFYVLWPMLPVFIDCPFLSTPSVSLTFIHN